MYFKTCIRKYLVSNTFYELFNAMMVKIGYLNVEAQIGFHNLQVFGICVAQ